VVILLSPKASFFAVAFSRDYNATPSTTSSSTPILLRARRLDLFCFTNKLNYAINQFIRNGLLSVVESTDVVAVVVNICIPSGSSHADVFPDLLTGPPFHYLSSLIRRVGSAVVPPPYLGSPRGSSRGGGGAGGLLLLLASPYQHGYHYSRLLSRHWACQEGVEG
jgi:hypothetical protein